jgi:hypothetical protein
MELHWKELSAHAWALMDECGEVHVTIRKSATEFGLWTYWHRSFATHHAAKASAERDVKEKIRGEIALRKVRDAATARQRPGPIKRFLRRLVG